MRGVVTSQTVRIVRLGHRGDGIAETANGPLYVAGALPGEDVEIERSAGDRAQLLLIVHPSPQRITPPCPHFAMCGGCQAQHMDETLYRSWKMDGLVTALTQQGIDFTPAALIPTKPRSRRRVTLALAQIKGRVTLGFHAARSETIIPVDQCQVMTPAIAARLPELANLLAPLAPLRDSVAVTILETSQGLDISVAAKKVPPPRASALFEAASKLSLARLTLGADSIEFARPLLVMRGIKRLQPPGGFAQAVSDIEELISDFTVQALHGAKRVVELFCGSGALTLRLARDMAVHGVESEATALAALDRSLRDSQALKPVTLEQRDLFRRPLLPSELTGFDAVLLDPPRQGALAQMPHLVQSKLKRIVYISCSPASFARDARALIDGGFRLNALQPFDQFLWSSHCELAAVFTR